MKPKSKRTATAILIIMLSALVLHCTSWLFSTTLRIVFYVEEGIQSVDENVQKAFVDLTENSDWEEHHESVTGIQRVLFATWIHNRSAVPASAQLYISSTCDLQTATEVEQGATLILDGISVPALDSIYLEAEDSYQYLENVDELKDFLMEGQACIYLMAAEAPFNIEVPESVAVIIDFTYEAD